MVSKLIISLLIVMAIFSLATGETEITIVGQNSPAVDIQAIQKAVDQGGTITLKGTFDFGNEGRVNITKDVKIIGETFEGGKPIAKIKGGYWTFHTPLPAKLPPEVPGPKITIQGIHFDGALWSPIYLAYSSGVTISSNKLTNIRPRPMGKQLVFGKPDLNYQQGISCNPGYAQTWETRKYLPDAFTGTLIIEDNDIDLTNDVPGKTMSQGVMVGWTTGINAQIQRNTVINCSRFSIETIDNYLGKDGSGMIIVKDNKLVPAIEGLPVPFPATPNGIFAGWIYDLSGAIDPQRNIKHIITNNAIRTRGKASLGIVASTDGAVVVSNAILSEGTEALALIVRSSDGYIAFNKIEGASSRPGIYVGTLKPMKGSKNVFIDTDLRQFKSSAADVRFDKGTSNNLYIGPKCKVSDLGSNNSTQMAK